jgi:hypothetical protein
MYALTLGNYFASANGVAPLATCSTGDQSIGFDYYPGLPLENSDIALNGQGSAAGDMRFGSWTLSRSKVLAENTATNLFDVAVPSNSGVMGKLKFGAYATDGTNYQVENGICGYSAVNKSGSITANTGSISDSSTATSTGSVTPSCSITSGTNLVHVRLSVNSSLTTTSIVVYYALENDSQSAVTAD